MPIKRMPQVAEPAGDGRGAVDEAHAHHDEREEREAEAEGHEPEHRPRAARRRPARSRRRSTQAASRRARHAGVELPVELGVGQAGASGRRRRRRSSRLLVRLATEEVASRRARRRGVRETLGARSVGAVSRSERSAAARAADDLRVRRHQPPCRRSRSARAPPASRRGASGACRRPAPRSRARRRLAAVEHLGDGGGIVVPAGEALHVDLAELPLLQGSLSRWRKRRSCSARPTASQNLMRTMPSWRSIASK